MKIDFLQEKLIYNSQHYPLVWKQKSLFYISNEVNGEEDELQRWGSDVTRSFVAATEGGVVRSSQWGGSSERGPSPSCRLGCSQVWTAEGWLRQQQQQPRQTQLSKTRQTTPLLQTKSLLFLRVFLLLKNIVEWENPGLCVWWTRAFALPPCRFPAQFTFSRSSFYYSSTNFTCSGFWFSS